MGFVYLLQKFTLQNLFKLQKNYLLMIYKPGIKFIRSRKLIISKGTIFLIKIVCQAWKAYIVKKRL